MTNIAVPTRPALIPFPDGAPDDLWILGSAQT